MGYPVFTEEMKKTHTILIPDMLPIHFDLINSILQNAGYKTECLTSSSRVIIDEGLKNVHNDTCYPALLVIGQFIDALNSGKYDIEHTALLITQTGGGCRASNYIFLLRKALKEKYPNVPVISINFSGLDKTSGFKLTIFNYVQLLYACYYGDLLMSLYNQTLPYEKHKGDSLKVLNECKTKLKKILNCSKIFSLKKNSKYIIDSFNTIEKDNSHKIKVGIVGEIYVKYSPLANNHLEDFLHSENCEAIVPALMDFIMYCCDSIIWNNEKYKLKNKAILLYKLVYKYVYGMQKKMNKQIMKHSSYELFHDFELLKKAANKYINEGVVMGEGWLIPAEMALLIESGCKNIVTCQPFGCLPNHIVSKGMQRVIKNNYPDANIVAIDYDPGATKVNQENRIKLMLASVNE